MDLQVNTISYVNNIIDFICALKFKDEIKANSLETKESMIASSAYISAYLKTDNKTDVERQFIIDNYVEYNSYYKSLQDKYGIDPYISRLAKDLDIVYTPSALIASNSYLEGYRSIYKQCLTYFYATGYAKSMEELPNYRKFCLMVINFMGYTNFMAKWLKNPFDVDLMTEEMLDKFTISFGISYFKKLPLQYKRKIAKNLNKLISNKGTDRVVIDILDIFDFSNINIFKYFLVNDEFIEVADSEGKLTKKVVKNPRFIAHNIKEKSLSESIKANSYKTITIDEATTSDAQWQVSEEQIAAANFDYVQTKYFSVDSGFELYKEGLGTVFIFNLIQKIRKDYRYAEALNVVSTLISPNSITLEDLLLTFQVITLDYHDIDDIIQFDLNNIAKVFSFTSKDDNSLNKTVFGSDVAKWTLKDLNTVTNYNFETLISIYQQNFNIYSNYKDKMAKSIDIKEFNNLKKLHQYKFIEKLNFDLFEGFSHYTNYIKSRNLDLYNYIMSTREIEDSETRKTAQEKQITAITDILNEYLTGITLYFSSTSLDILSSYLREVIEVFKSFTVSLKELDLFIVVKEFGDTKVIDDLGAITLNNTYKDKIPFLWVKMDKLKSKWNYDDKMFVHDYVFKNSKYDKIDHINYNDKLRYSDTNLVYQQFFDRNQIVDNYYFTAKNTAITYSDKIEKLNDTFNNFKKGIKSNSFIKYKDDLKFAKGNFTINSKINYSDKAKFVSGNKWFDKVYKFIDSFRQSGNIIKTYEYSTIKDTFTYNENFDLEDKLRFGEKKSFKTSFVKQEDNKRLVADVVKSIITINDKDTVVITDYLDKYLLDNKFNMRQKFTFDDSIKMKNYGYNLKDQMLSINDSIKNIKVTPALRNDKIVTNDKIVNKKDLFLFDYDIGLIDCISRISTSNKNKSIITSTDKIIYTSNNQIIDLTANTLDSRITYSRVGNLSFIQSDGTIGTVADNIWPVEYKDGKAVGRHPPEPTAINYQAYSSPIVSTPSDSTYFANRFDIINGVGLDNRPIMLLSGQDFDRFGLYDETTATWLLDSISANSKLNVWNKITSTFKINSSDKIRTYIARAGTTIYAYSKTGAIPAGTYTATSYRKLVNSGSMLTGMTQIESGSFSTSYIPNTDTVLNTRNAPVIKIATGGNNGCTVYYSDGTNEKYTFTQGADTFQLPLYSGNWGTKYLNMILYT